MGHSKCVPFDFDGSVFGTFVSYEFNRVLVFYFFIFFVPLIMDLKLREDDLAMKYLKSSYFWYLFGMCPTFYLGNWLVISINRRITEEIFFSSFLFVLFFLVSKVPFYLKIFEIKQGEFTIVKYDSMGNPMITQRTKL